MTLDAGNRLTVELTHTESLGTLWIVRVLKKGALRTRVECSDWFLDEDQAARYARTVAEELRSGLPLAKIRQRSPGWVYRPDAPVA
ncbi:MAG: hypothetical protein WB626_08800 [Bacteroidota bacterium]